MLVPSMPGFGSRLALLGRLHTQALFEQAAKPSGQWETLLHCSQTLLAQMGASSVVHEPQE